MRLDRCLVVLALASAACTQILGIDGTYSLDEGSGGKLIRTDVSSSGGRPPGSGGSAVVVGSGGLPLTLDSGHPNAPKPDASTEDAAIVCAEGKKYCHGGCNAPDPSIGCGPSDCTKCADPPENAFLVCAAQKCDFQCVTGEKTTDGTGCKIDSSGSGGAPGDDASTPTKGYFESCVKGDRCPPCGVFPGCCNPIEHCGCLYVAACI